jgi:putative ABC transport system permease protein
VLIQQAWLQIRNKTRFFSLFLLNLSLGLSGLVAVQGFRHAMEGHFESRSRDLMGADLEVSGRGELSDSTFQEIAEKLDAIDSGRSYSLYNMMNYEAHSRLVQVKAFDPGLPYYGEYVLEENSLSSFNSHDDHAWIYPELAIQMSIEVGDSIRLGQTSFLVSGLIRQDPQQGFSGMSLAPRVYVTSQGLEAAQLIQLGSVVQNSHLFKLLPTARLDDSVVREIEKQVDDPALRVLTPQRSGEQMLTAFQYMSDFLGLVSLVALFLASVGLSYLYRSYLFSQHSQIAIFRSLGLSHGRVTALYFSQLCLLGVMGSLSALFFGQFILFGLFWLAQNALSLEIPYQWLASTTVAQILAIGIFSILFLALPLLAPLGKVTPLRLISGQESPESEEIGMREKVLLSLKGFVLWSPWFVFYLLLSIWIAHSWQIGGLFYLVFSLTPVAIYPLLSLLLGALGGVAQRLPFTLKMAILYLSRFRTASITSFLAITLAALLLNIIPMIQKGLVEELLGDGLAEQRPSLFMFDVQEEQLEGLLSFIEKSNQSLIDLSPMVRGRLRHVNGQPFDYTRREQGIQTREEERSEQFQNRGLNLSYRPHLNVSEELVAGRMFESEFDWSIDEVGEVSLERRYAQRMGLELGDVIEVEVLGMPVLARVTSLRRVRWTSFLPNFFLLFQPGMIDDAPKIYLAALGPMSEEERNSFQLAMFESFPTVSLLDTTRAVERVMELMTQLAKALYAMALMSFLVGGLVLFSISSHQMTLKSRDVVLLKAQGLAHRRLAWIFRVEVLLVGLGASLTGALLGMGVSFGVSHLFFDGVWVFDVAIPVSVILLIVIGTLMISEWVMKRVLALPSRQALEEGAP